MRDLHGLRNLCFVVGTAEALELDLRRAADALAGAAPVPGRMERVDAGQPFTVTVDYESDVPLS